MKSLYRPSRLACCSAIGLLALCLITSCKTTTTETPPKPDAREQLVGSLKGANVAGYQFEMTEDDAQVTTSLTNGALRDLIKLDSGTTNVVLKYTSVRDKKANTAKTYKAEINRVGNALTLLVTDFATGQVVSKDEFPPPDKTAPTGGAAPTFETLEDCIKEFNCTKRGALECEANRTCKDQFAGLTCCLKNGQCFSVHMIIRPTSLRCRLRDFVANFEGFVLSQ